MAKHNVLNIGTSKKTLFSLIIFTVFLISWMNLTAQNFDLAIQASFAKFDIVPYGRKLVVAPKNYHNGFELGPLVGFRPKNTLFVFNAGMLYNTMFHKNYNLNFVSIPVGLNIELGKKAGVQIGIGLKVWYLLKVPEEILLYHHEDDINRFLFSYIAQTGIFFKVQKLRFLLCLQIESFQTPLYYEPTSHGTNWEYDLNMVSYNLTVSFWDL